MMVKFENRSNECVVVISNICPFCGKKNSFEVAADKFTHAQAMYNGGALIQNTFSFLTSSQRELMQTGICDECWDKMC